MVGTYDLEVYASEKIFFTQLPEAFTRTIAGVLLLMIDTDGDDDNDDDDDYHYYSYIVYFIDVWLDRWNDRRILIWILVADDDESK